MPIIVENNPSSAELFGSATGGGSRVVPTLEALKEALATAGDEYAIVLGPNVDLEAAASLADTLRVTRPATSVILVRRRVDTSVLAEALRSGMREVVEDRDLTGLGEAVRRARQVWEALNGQTGESPESAGKIITVFSPKGGVGKTTVAVNVALALAEDSTQRVCLVDLDLAFGDIAITLQLFPARTIADAVHVQSALDFGLLETLLTKYEENLFALVAPVQPDAKDSISTALVGQILRTLKANFDFVVVDTSPSFDEHSLQAFDETDVMLLVTTLDVPTLKNVKIAVETLELLNFPASRRRLVLNRADDKVGLDPEKVESTLGMKVDWAVPSSSQVANATNSGEPIVKAVPRHPVSIAVKKLASDVSGTATAATHPASPKSRAAAPKRGLLRRSGR